MPDPAISQLHDELLDLQGRNHQLQGIFPMPSVLGSNTPSVRLEQQHIFFYLYRTWLVASREMRGIAPLVECSPCQRSHRPSLSPTAF